MRKKPDDYLEDEYLDDDELAEEEEEQEEDDEEDDDDGGFEFETETEDDDLDLDDDSEEEDEDADEDEESDEESDDDEDEAKSAKAKKDDGDPNAAKKNPKRSFQKRVNKLTREKHDALREAEKLRKENAELKASQAKTSAETSRPKQEDFEDYEDFEQALEKWARESAHAEAASDTDDAGDDALSLEEIELSDTVDNIVAQAEQPDFQDVVFAPNLKLTFPMVKAASESDLAADLLYYLGQHPKEAARISQLPDSAIPREIGRLEAKLEGGTASAKPRPKSKSSAPAPVKPGKTGGAVKSAKLSPKMKTDDWIKQRRKELAAQS